MPKFNIVKPIGTYITIKNVKNKKTGIKTLTLKNKGLVYKDTKGLFTSGKINTYLKE